MKKLNYLIIAITILFTSCDYFQYDNYDEPDSGVKGVLKDKTTSKDFTTEAGMSYKIDYYELSWAENHTNTQSEYFWGKADASFVNTKIFAGKYQITFKEGFFYQPPSQTIDLSKGSIKDLGTILVVPYARVKFDTLYVGTSKTNLVIKYTVIDTEKEYDDNVVDITESKYNLLEAHVFISSKSPVIGVNNTESDLTLNSVKDISTYTVGFPTSYTDTKVKGLIPGASYWVRIGVLTSNPQKRYVLSTVKQITIPK